MSSQSLEAGLDIGVSADDADIDHIGLGDVAHHGALDGGNVGDTQIGGNVALAVDGVEAVGVGVPQDHGHDTGGNTGRNIVSGLLQRKSKFRKSHCFAPLI